MCRHTETRSFADDHEHLFLISFVRRADFENRADCSGRAVHGVHADAYAQRWHTEDRGDDQAEPEAKKPKAV